MKALRNCSARPTVCVFILRESSVDAADTTDCGVRREQRRLLRRFLADCRASCISGVWKSLALELGTGSHWAALRSRTLHSLYAGNCESQEHGLPRRNWLGSFRAGEMMGQTEMSFLRHPIARLGVVRLVLAQAL